MEPDRIEKAPRVILAKKPPWVAESALTVPWIEHLKIICTDNCAECPMSKLGCALQCIRFPDKVCEGCPCRASKFAELSDDPG